MTMASHTLTSKYPCCRKCHGDLRLVTWVVEPLFSGAVTEHHATVVCDACGWQSHGVDRVRDASHLVRIETEKPWNFRGQCTSCQKKSNRWSCWDHVELWFNRHVCQPRKQRERKQK